MGGAAAPDELPEGADTQVWLATSDDPAATVTGRYVRRRRERQANPAAYDIELLGFLQAAAQLTEVQLPDRCAPAGVRSFGRRRAIQTS